MVRPADVSPADVDIYYHFVADRTTASQVPLQKLSPSANYLTHVYQISVTTDNQNAVIKELLGVLYNL